MTASLHTRHGLDFSDLYKLVRGQVDVKKCPCCDINGHQYWDGSTGMGLNSSPAGIDPENLERDACENCAGLGFLIKCSE